MNTALKLLRWSGIATLMLSVGCVDILFSCIAFEEQYTTSVVNGQLEGTRSLPPRGKGYRTYSYFGSAIGRQYAHHKVIQTLENSLC